MGAGVLAVATSPAIDRISLTRGDALKGIVRASQALETPGGKAIHAAMVARALGARTHLVAPVGGRGGELLRDLLADLVEATVADARVRFGEQEIRLEGATDGLEGEVVRGIRPTSLALPEPHTDAGWRSEPSATCCSAWMLPR
jgi:hypothetical protein